METESDPSQTALTLSGIVSNCQFIGEAQNHLSGPGNSISAGPIFRRNLVTNIDYRAPGASFQVFGSDVLVEFNVFVNNSGDLLNNNNSLPQRLTVRENAYLTNRPIQNMLGVGTAGQREMLLIERNVFAGNDSLEPAFLINCGGEWALASLDSNQFVSNAAYVFLLGGLDSLGVIANNRTVRSESPGSGPISDSQVTEGDWTYANNLSYLDEMQPLFRGDGIVSNSIFWYEDPAVSNHLSFFSPVTNCIVKGGHSPGSEIIDADPQIAGIVAGGWGRVLGYDANLQMTLLDLGASDPPPTRLPDPDELIQFPGNATLVAARQGDIVLVWGDPFRYRPPPDIFPWFMEDYHLRPSSPAIGAGIGPAADSDVPLFDFDGEPRSGLTCDIGPDEYSPRAEFEAWGRLWITAEANSATMQHIVIEGGDGVLIENSNVSFADATLRQNRLYGLSAPTPLAFGAFERVSAIGNLGKGIDAPGSDLTDCVAEYNLGDGLRGAFVQGSRAFNNDGVGIRANNAAFCEAIANSGDGVLLDPQGGESSNDLFARENGRDGIRASSGDIDNARAERNVRDGIAIAAGGRCASGKLSSMDGTGSSTISPSWKTAFRKGMAARGCSASGDVRCRVRA
jgi:hypothetical protein